VKLNLFDFLLPREVKFYDHFDEQISLVVEASLVFRDLIANLGQVPEPEAQQQIGRIRELEARGDAIERRIIDDLSLTFITPFDREDIHSLAVSIDRALDILKTSVDKLDVYRIRSTPPHVTEFTGLIVDMCGELRGLMGLFRAKGNVDDTVRRMHEFEHTADYLLHVSLAELFETNTDAIEIIKLKEIYEQLETMTDCLDFVAKAVRGIVVKLG
jgi:uncharacterized protein